MTLLAATVLSVVLLATLRVHPNQERTAAGADPQTIKVTRAGSQPSAKGPAENFTGSVRVDYLFQPEEPSRTSGAFVTFEPGARTAWHVHPLGQTLIVTAGSGWVQQWGGSVQVIRPGDVVRIPPGQKHWHGATATTGMTHIAIQEQRDGKTVDWMEKVSDEHYGAALPAAAPLPPTLDVKGAGALSSFLAGAVSRGDVPGVVAIVVAPDRVLYHEAFGRMNVAQGVDMRKDAIFRIASMTKPVTSVAAMMLVEQGKLGLDDEVSKYLPAFKSPQVISRLDLAAGTYETRPATRPITIRQLLTHTSGIGYSWSDPGLAMIQKLTARTSEVDLPLVHEPGEKWTYGASTKVLGNVVETLSGQRIDAFLESRILLPLGMHDTAHTVPQPKHARVVTLHRKTDGRPTETPNPATIAAPVRGDGGLFSTAADYGRFVQMILNRGQLGTVRLLKPDTVQGMGRNHTGDVRVRPQPVANTEYSKPYPLGAGEDVWGLGFQLAAPARPDPGMRRPGSMSWAGINNTFFWIDPQAEIGVVVLMQMLPFYDEAALGVLRGVEARVYRHLQRQAP